ncbi:unnamed protein product, partial [Brachionus calyciflorus]
KKPVPNNVPYPSIAIGGNQPVNRTMDFNNQSNQYPNNFNQQFMNNNQGFPERNNQIDDYNWTQSRDGNFFGNNYSNLSHNTNVKRMNDQKKVKEKKWYHSYEEISNILKETARKNPDKTYLYSIGKSTGGKDLWVLALADSKPSEKVLLRPEAKYVANIHGNEVVGKEILLRLIDYFLTNQTDPDVSFIMKNLRVHILPLMNPDGYGKSYMGDCNSVQGRYNNEGYDLNRNFPDLFENNTYPIQPETKAILNWLETNNFVLSGSFHGGALVANYPFDNYAVSDGFSAKKSSTNDEDVFRLLALTYSKNHLKMTEGCNGDSFPDGITNGAEWYPLRGGMQDVNYWKYGCMEITFEVSCCKYPQKQELEGYWNDNKKSLVEYLKKANTGLKGIVKFANGQKAANVTIKIDSREPYFKTNKNGEYYRILLPGNYTLSAMFNCKTIISKKVQIISSTEPVVFNIILPSNRYQEYKKRSLDSTAVFCNKKRQVV